MSMTNEIEEPENIGNIFIVNLNKNDSIPLQGQLLINTWGNDICRIAYRELPWDTWSPPSEGEKQ